MYTQGLPHPYVMLEHVLKNTVLAPILLAQGGKCTAHAPQPMSRRPEIRGGDASADVGGTVLKMSRGESWVSKDAVPR